MKVIVSAFILVLSSTQAMAQWRFPPRQDPPSHQGPDRGRQDPDRGRVGDRGPGGRWDRDWSRSRRQHSDEIDSHLDAHIREFKQKLEEAEDLAWEIQQREDADPRGEWDRRNNYHNSVARLLDRLKAKSAELNELAVTMEREDTEKRNREREMWQRERENRERDRRRAEEAEREAREQAERLRRENGLQLAIAKAEVNKALLLQLGSSNVAGIYTVRNGVRDIGVSRNAGIPQWDEAVIALGREINVRVNHERRPGVIGFATGGRNDAEWNRLIGQFRDRIHAALNEAIAFDRQNGGRGDDGPGRGGDRGEDRNRLDRRIRELVRWGRDTSFMIGSGRIEIIAEHEFRDYHR